jgi:hypothetical protein
MKDSIAAKTLMLLVIASLLGLCICGCDKKTEREIAALKQEAVTSYVNLPNPNGSVTPVKIIRQGNVWVGPRGEQYTSYPTVEQLQPVYGTK